METWQHGLQLLTQGVHLCIGGFIEPPLLTTLCHEGVPAALGQSWRGLASFSKSTRAQTLYIPVLTSLLDLPVSFSCTPVWNTAGVRHRWPFTLLSFICIKWEHLLRPCVLYLLLVVWVFLKYIFDRVSCSSGCLQVCYVVKDDPFTPDPAFVSREDALLRYLFLKAEHSLPSLIFFLPPSTSQWVYYKVVMAIYSIDQQSSIAGK